MNSTANSTAGVTIDYGSGKIVTSIMFTTANDSPERDPTKFKIYGSNTSGTNWSDTSWTLIAENLNTNLTTSRFSDGHIVSISNTFSYRYYKIEFTELRARNLANSVQISRIMLYEDGNSEILFNTQADSVNAPSKISQLAGSSISPTTLPIISRTGYLFNGWFDSQSGGSLVEQLPEIMPASPITYYAQWTPITYTVDFDGNTSDSGTMDSILATYDQTFDLPENGFNKIGHSFVRWDTQADGGGDSYSDLASLPNLSNVSGSNITLYAQWTVNQYTLNFETFTSSAISSITADFGTSIQITPPSLPGYLFEGWYLENTFDTLFDHATMPALSASTISLYAKLTEIIYSVNYNNLLDGTNAEANPLQFTFSSSNLDLLNPSRTGYTFKGWFENSDFSGTHKTQINAGTIGDIDLYAQWEINQYTLSLNANGGSSTSDITADYLSDITLPTPSRQGYRFDGWFEDGVRVTYTEMPLENRTLEARWTALPYTLTFVNSITGEQTTLTASFNAPIQMPQINQPGYTFGGWLENNRPVRFTTMPLGNRTLVASFNARNYTISFSSSLGTAPSSIEAAYQSSVSLPTMSVEHHIFKGWQGPNGLIQGSFQVPLNGASLTAVFEPKTYTVSFAGDGINIPSMEIPFEGALSLPTPSKEGYRFTGWLLNGSPVNLTQMPGENITLTATFERIELTLRLISEGQVIRQSTHFVNDSFTLPNPQKRGHTFEGWFEGNTRVIAGAMPSRNLTLNARFLINSYPVTFIDYDSSETSRYEYESTIELPQKERLGYQFMGWSYQGQLIDSLTISDTVVELTAVYQPFTARMTFASPSQVFTLNITTDQSLSNISTMSVPSGYVWQGFYTMPFGAGDPVIDGFMVDNAHEVSMYPYYLRAGQAFEVSRGRLSVDPYYFGEVDASEGSEHRFPWFEVVSFITLSSALITLHVLSKGGKVHENL